MQRLICINYQDVSRYPSKGRTIRYLRGWLQKSPKKFEQAFILKKKRARRKLEKKNSCKHPSCESKLQFLDPYLELLNIKYEEYIECRDNPDDHPLLHYGKLPNL
jgi:hypothetical protein